MNFHSNVTSIPSESPSISILVSLIDGRYLTANELAYMSAVKPQMANYHLAELIEENLVIVEKHGGHLYYRLANKEIAQMLKLQLSTSQSVKIRPLRQSIQTKDVQFARTCYTHLAGQLGVQLTKSMVNLGYLKEKEKEFIITPGGEKFFTDFGLNLPKLRKQRRSFSHACIDFSERHHHLAGALGQAITQQLFEEKWIARVSDSRAIKITDKGHNGLKEHFRLSL